MKTRTRVILTAALLCACSSGPSSESPSPAPNMPEQTDPTSPATDVEPTPKPTGWKAQLSQVDKLVYRYQDSSVPPQYHRSKTITVTPSSVKKVVDSYGDVISENANPITDEQFRQLLATLEPLGVDVATAPAPGPGCTGGTADGLWLYVGETEIFGGRISSCGGEQGGEIRGDLKKVAANATALLKEDAEGPKAAQP